MSKEDAKAFHEKAKTDPEIQKALHERTKSPVDIGKAHGLSFTKEELDAVRSEQDQPAGPGTPWSTNA